MYFISHGDYLLPLYFPVYWVQHVYIWSYERGAVNPDGILRLPGRLLDIVVFAISGNVAFGYFYLFSCLIIAFLAFLWFARSFLNVTQRGAAVLAALLFAFNPIFLGNVSKIGLVLAVAMLPIALTALKLAVAKKRLRYVLLCVLALNISLLHPFTFSVNALVVGVYAVFLIRNNVPFLQDNWPKIVGVGLVALFLNAYCILPLASLGTLDKTALSDTATTTTVDYHSLVDVANTGDLITGLSLAKSVLKDYEFFGNMTWPFYFLGVFGFYALLFGLYLRVERRAKPDDRRRFVLALGLFLVLVVLATASYLRADLLIKFLIDLPGGWMFRSPLKWQLYLPLVLCMALAVALKYVRGGWHLKGLYVAFLACLILMNGYLCLQIYERLLTPRKVTTFAGLLATGMAHKNLLFVDSGECVEYAIEHPNVATELNEVLISKTVQVKHQPAGQVDSVNLGQYDFVMGCRGTLERTLLTKQYAFTLSSSFADNTYQLYENTKPQPYAAVVTQVFTLKTATQIGGKYALAARTLHEPFTFVTGSMNNLPATGLIDIFDNLSPGNIKNGIIQSSVRPIGSKSQQVVVSADSPVYMATSQNSLQFSSVSTPGMKPVTANQPLSIKVNADAPLQVTYRDPAFAFQNRIPNASLESGPWQTKVGDCNNYDGKANLSMSMNKNTKTDGKQSLELVARSHIACTGPPEIPVTAGGQYLLSFDYQAGAGRYAGYNVGFDDTARTSISERLPDTAGKWAPHTAIITIPAHARQLRFTVYAYPNKATGETGKARYDNFSLLHIPPVVSRFFIVSGQQTSTAAAPAVQFTKVNPTKTIVSITAAKDPFYLTTKESYNPLWKLRFNDAPDGIQGLFAHTHATGSHTQLNNAMNGWHIDPQAVCAQSSACSRQANGTYNISLVMEFTPQRWFYVGALVSLMTALGALLVVGYSVYQDTRGRQQ